MIELNKRKPCFVQGHRKVLITLKNVGCYLWKFTGAYSALQRFNTISLLVTIMKQKSFSFSKEGESQTHYSLNMHF